MHHTFFQKGDLFEYDTYFYGNDEEPQHQEVNQNDMERKKYSLADVFTIDHNFYYKNIKDRLLYMFSFHDLINIGFLFLNIHI